MTSEQKAYFEEHKERFLKELFELLRFESVSGNQEYKPHCNDCASWVSDHLTDLGFSSRLVETDYNPMVFAELDRKAGITVLAYGHYDVMDPGDSSLWHSPPFEPETRNGRFYARGAQDDKGQFFYIIKAVEYLIRNDLLNVNLKFLIEGDEETARTDLDSVVTELGDKLSADYLLVCDTQMVDEETPTAILSLRGICGALITLSGPKYDLHSGKHGGLVKNPAIALGKLLGSLIDDTGKIVVPGFYEDVIDVDKDERLRISRMPFDQDAYVNKVGVAPIGGEKPYLPQERTSIRPTLDVNGIESGHVGPGIKTIIPAQARARLTCRLVPNQHPKRILDKVCSYLSDQVPDGFKIEFAEQVCADYLWLGSDMEIVSKVLSVLKNIGSKPPVLLRHGGSIPIVPKLANLTKAKPVLVGFGTEAGMIHAPNESFTIEQFEMGFHYVAGFLQSLQKS